MANDTESEKQIREFNDRWAAAVEAKDIDAILANYIDDVVIFDVPPPLQIKGGDAYRKNWEHFLQKFKGAVKCEFKDTLITAGEDVAFLSMLTRVSEKEDAESGHGSALPSDLPRQMASGWRHTNIYRSLPADRNNLQ